MQPAFFQSGDDFREWLLTHHATVTELFVGFHNAKSRTKGITYKQALDEALCFGWIDGVRIGVDETRYRIRFTPRKKSGSKWSLVNIKRFRELERLGKIHAAGHAAFQQADASNAGRYSYERKNSKLEPALLRRFQSNTKAWTFFNSTPPSYQRLMIFRIASAKRPETRAARLSELIALSEKGIRADLVERAKMAQARKARFQKELQLKSGKSSKSKR